MKLNRLTERIWICPFEEERDRPNLGYIRGDRWSLAVDAGHSADHIRGFYHALEDSGLPLPELTVMTHWHWDHTFAMHAAHGLCLANALTNRHLIDFRERLDKEGSDSSSVSTAASGGNIKTAHLSSSRRPIWSSADRCFWTPAAVLSAYFRLMLRIQTIPPLSRYPEKRRCFSATQTAESFPKGKQTREKPGRWRRP